MQLAQRTQTVRHQTSAPRRITVYLLAVSAVLLATSAAAQTIYHTTADWRSTDAQIGTGGALVDLNGDRWLDLVVANGNDIQRQRLTVFYNRGDGTYPLTPDWQSADIAYNGHLSVADVNGDGWLDVAVAHLGSGTSTIPIAKLYVNHAGTLSTNPEWSANVLGNAFGCAFGDMNNDGRPDLAVATGWAYGGPAVRRYVYLNVNGTLGATPGWSSVETGYAQGADWVDADGDGWLDLAFAIASNRSRVYRNTGGTLEFNASWTITDVSSQDAIMVTHGDVTGDGLAELIFADNNQLAGGSGRFRQYNAQAAGFWQTVAGWTYNEGYCSAVALADVDADGRLDLATGAWWDKTRIFLNKGTGFAAVDDWRSTDSTVVEKICFGDINKDGLRMVRHAFENVPAGQRLFQLPDQPIQELCAVFADGALVPPSAHTASLEHGWLTIGVDAQHVLVEYNVSTRLDMATTDWEQRGNQVFYNLHIVLGDANCDGRVNFDDINPFVMLLAGTYGQQFPYCDGPHNCDLDQNGRVDFGDINPFVELLAG